ncbi:hypothetical protein ACQEV4_38435 [Streptomyces shenzhenensis]|uniref:hypothetical protein n=1 Tax=Streptomyces shenzhenensis TaxID=943815 RepID=UPI0033EB8517
METNTRAAVTMFCVNVDLRGTPGNRHDQIAAFSWIYSHVDKPVYYDVDLVRTVALAEVAQPNLSGSGSGRSGTHPTEDQPGHTGANSERCRYTTPDPLSSLCRSQFTTLSVHELADMTVVILGAEGVTRD